VGLIWSGIGPTDRLTWFMETVPVMIGIAILVPTWRRFPLTPLIYTLLAFHAWILVIGGHYTYAEVPWFNDLKDHYDLSRNYFDRLGHFVQGFVPAILAREILIRNTCLKSGPWLFLYVTSFCLAFSALYEMLEWWAAIFSETGAEAFLGTQGDIWDTQWDMFLALIGAMLGQIILGTYHDRQIAELENQAA
jgi:putative membrane protein